MPMIDQIFFVWNTEAARYTALEHSKPLPSQTYRNIFYIIAIAYDFFYHHINRCAKDCLQHWDTSILKIRQKMSRYLSAIPQVCPAFYHLATSRFASYQDLKNQVLSK